LLAKYSELYSVREIPCRFQFMTSQVLHASTSQLFQPLPLVEVRASGVHGRGVYATQFIAKGTRIIEYTGTRVPWDSVPDDSEDPRTFLFGLDNGKDVIDPEIGGNDARWINHSCDPNCEAIEEDDERVFIDALRDLQPGEELFYDYQLEVDEPITNEVKEESRCYCGASSCRGTMLETDK
jgi:Proteins containing SET domain